MKINMMTTKWKTPAVELLQVINDSKYRSVMLVLLALFTLIPFITKAHCDSYDGPLIKDAMKALETERVEFVYKWIESEYEREINTLFQKTVAQKSGDQDIFEIVKKFFLETLVRLHRKGEGAPFTGLKPAGSASPILIMADKALETGNVENLNKAMVNQLKTLINEKYQDTFQKSKHKDESPEKGRAYVRAYVEYTHFLELVHSDFDQKDHSHSEK